MRSRRGGLIAVVASLAAANAFAQSFQPPAYDVESGPTVLIDEVHNNGHTKDGRYRPFADLLWRDGYAVERIGEIFSDDALEGAEVLVIANAIRDPRAMRLPTESAFSDVEIEAVYRWVDAGGSLLLITDHMPWAGAAEKLAARFGVLINNGYAVTPGGPNPLAFSRSDASLRDHAIVAGRTEAEYVPYVATYGGTAFRLREGVDAGPLMVFSEGSIVLLTRELVMEPSAITPETPRIPAEGMLQGAALLVGEGRVAVFGEAAMFTAQAAPGGQSFGINDPQAPHNAQFVLNVMHWLSGLL